MPEKSGVRHESEEEELGFVTIGMVSGRLEDFQDLKGNGGCVGIDISDIPERGPGGMMIDDGDG